MTTKRSPAYRARRNDNSYKSSGWCRDARRRMRAGLERCRGCGRRLLHTSQDPEGLRLGHIQAYSIGRSSDISNVTIVCKACDQFMGDGDWTGVVASLADEQWVPAWPARPLGQARSVQGIDPQLLEQVAARLGVSA